MTFRGFAGFKEGSGCRSFRFRVSGFGVFGLGVVGSGGVRVLCLEFRDSGLEIVISGVP